MKKLLSTLAAMLLCITLTQAQLVITEIMFNPPESGTDSLEFLEIYNAGSSSVNLNGYAIDFAGARRDTFTSSFILAPGGLMVTAVNDTAVYNQFNMSFYPRQWASSGLSNTGTLVVLRNASGIVDSVRYTNAWEPSANGNGTSLILCNPSSDNALSSSWDSSATNTGNTINAKALFGSPGVLETCAAAVPSIQFSAATASVVENVGTVTLTLNIANPSATLPTSVDVSLGGASTASAADYSGFTSPTTVTFPAGSSSAQIVTFTIVDDVILETTETLVFTLGNFTNSATAGAASTHTLSVTDNDAAAPVVNFASASTTVNENAGTVTVTLNIASANATATTVDVRIGTSSTAAPADYTNFTSPTTVTFPANSSASQQITIDIVDDAAIESTETIVFELLNTSNAATVGMDSIYTINITNNDVAPVTLVNLVITEINYNNPAADSVEFIEIYNNDTVTVNLLGYQLTNGIFFTFPSRTLAPGAYILVCQDSVLFQQRFGISAYRWNTGNSLNNTGEAIVLRNNTGAILDSIFYSSTAPWPTTASGNGPSAQLCNINSNNNDGSNWGASNNATGVFVGGVQVFATPGTANTYCRSPYPVLPIGIIDNTNANGEPDSLGLSFEIRGIVHCGDFRVGTGLDFYLINSNNEGIKVFSSSDRGYTVTDGDSLHIWGAVSQGNGVTEFLVDSLFFILPGNATVAPMTVTTAIAESMEGSLLQLNNVSLVNTTQWTGAGTGFNVDVTNGSTTWQLRIDDAVSYFGQAAPSGVFSVYGFGSQFDASAPYTTGYQLLACDGSIVVGTELTEAAATVLIYPNPVQNELNVSGEQLETVIISNVLGQELSRHNNINSNFSTISTSTLPTGIYNVAIISNGKLSVQQFVKR